MEQQVSKKPSYMRHESPPHLDSQLHGGGVGEYGGGGGVHSNTLSAHNKPEEISPTSSSHPRSPAPLEQKFKHKFLCLTMR
jgi:hypothetical protein